MDPRSPFYRPLRLADLLRDPFADAARRWPRYRAVLPALLLGTLAACTANAVMPMNLRELADARRLDALLLALGLIGAFTAQNLASFHICRVASDEGFEPWPAPGELFSTGLRRCFALTAVAILQVLLLVLSAVAMIVPVFFVAPMLVAAIPVCALEHAGPLHSLRRSRTLTEGRRRLCLVATGAIVMLAMLPIEMPLEAANAPKGIVFASRVLVNSALHLAFTVQAAQIWCGLRFEKGEYAPGSLAHVFD